MLAHNTIWRCIVAKIRRFQRGETIPIWAETKTWAIPGVYDSPDQGIEITITDPLGVVQVPVAPATTQAMTESSAGKFVYYFKPEDTDPLGWWRVRCKAQDGLLADAKYTISDGGFYLEI